MIDTFKTSIAFIYTFFQLYELSLSLPRPRIDTFKTSIAFADTFFSNTTNYHLTLPRPRIDTFKTNITFIYTFFQLYELSP